MFPQNFWPGWPPTCIKRNVWEQEMCVSSNFQFRTTLGAQTKAKNRKSQNFTTPVMGIVIFSRKISSNGSRPKPLLYTSSNFHLEKNQVLGHHRGAGLMQRGHFDMTWGTPSCGWRGVRSTLLQVMLGIFHFHEFREKSQFLKNHFLAFWKHPWALFWSLNSTWGTPSC